MHFVWETLYPNSYRTFVEQCRCILSGKHYTQTHTALLLNSVHAVCLANIISEHTAVLLNSVDAFSVPLENRKELRMNLLTQRSLRFYLTVIEELMQPPPPPPPPPLLLFLANYLKELRMILPHCSWSVDAAVCLASIPNTTVHGFYRTLESCIFSTEHYNVKELGMVLPRCCS